MIRNMTLTSSYSAWREYEKQNEPSEVAHTCFCFPRRTTVSDVTWFIQTLKDLSDKYDVNHVKTVSEAEVASNKTNTVCSPESSSSKNQTGKYPRHCFIFTKKQLVGAVISPVNQNGH